MKIVYFLLLIIIIILLVLIISIRYLNKKIIELNLELISKLTIMQENIIKHIIIVNTKEFIKVKVKDIK